MYKSGPTLVSSTNMVMSGNSGQTTPNLIFPSSGSYYIQIVAQSGGTVYATSSTVSISAGSTLGSITVTSSSSTPTIYEDFTLTVALADACGNTFLTLTSLTLTSSTNIAGTTTGSTLTGSATFSVYSTTIGLNTITATGGTKTGTVTVTLQTPGLKFISFSPTV